MGILTKPFHLQRLSGVLWIVAVVSVIASLAIVLSYDITLNANDIVKQLHNVNAYAGAHTLELLFDEVSFIAMVAVAAPLFIIFSSYNKGLALLGSLLLAAGATVGAVHDMGNFALTSLAADYVNATATQAATLEAIARSTLITAKWGVNIAATFIVLFTLVYSLILMSERALPRLLGAAGVVASVLGLASVSIAVVAGMGESSPMLEQLGYALYLPLMLWQLTFGIWLLRWGRRVQNQTKPHSALQTA